MSERIVEVTDDTFESEVIQSSSPVVVDFWAPWCGPCRVMEPVLADLADRHGEHLKFTKMNVDSNQRTSARFDILSIPTLLVFEHGEVQKKVIGAVPRRRLEDELAGWLNGAA